MTTPRLSVLLPVRNDERYLPFALASLSRQTFTDWELVAVDDGSNDATPAILAEAARRDARVRSLMLSEQGLVPALNGGLAACRAPLVARMDSDDISHPRRLELQMARMEADPMLGLVATSFRHFPRRHVRVGMLAYEAWQNSLTSHDAILRDLFVESPFVHPSVVFRKREVEKVGGYRDMGWAEDYDLWLRLASAGTRFDRLPQTLFFWRDRPERATRTMQEYSAQAFRACKAHHLKEGFLKGETCVTLAGAGLEGRGWRRTLENEGIRVVRWVDVDPRKIGRTLHDAPVIAPDKVTAGNGKMLVTVGTRGARDGVRSWAVQAGFREGTDFLCVT
ncbi:MAG: glycosyltransferase group 2 family [Geobacteraceae bacterium]|nr:MAG: glycosyltransferase group 2 family [Geobacteraceae bacterium]